jgi:hypothetical protein
VQLDFDLIAIGKILTPAPRLDKITRSKPKS